MREDGNESMNQEESRHPGGRPLKFATPELLLEAFNEWKQEFATGGSLIDEIPDVEGFCEYTDSYRNLLNEYENKEEFSGAIKRIKNWIYYRKKQLAMSGKMNATVFIFDAKNNAGYVDRSEQDLTSGGGRIAPVLVRFVGEDGTNGNTDTSRV